MKNIVLGITIAILLSITLIEPCLATSYNDCDVNCDGQVNICDIVCVGLQWGTTGMPGWIRADVNKDGSVNIGDIATICLHCGNVVEPPVTMLSDPAPTTPSPSTGFGLSPALVYLKYSTKVTTSITIFNEANTSKHFAVQYEVPSTSYAGYSMPPGEAGNWVNISASEITLAANSTGDIQVTVDIPQGANSPTAWVFWIAVKDSPDGMVQSEVTATFAVTTNLG